MPIQVIMPKLGESVDEGTITKWLKASGEKVEEYEPLLEVNTDKVDTEVPSPASGVVLEILAPEGATVRAGAILALIEAVGEAPATEVGQTGRGVTPPPQQMPSTPGGRPERREFIPQPQITAAGRNVDLGFISPVVAKIAAERGVDLRLVRGTGQGGRITKKDLLAYLEAPPTFTATTFVAPSLPSSATTAGEGLLPLTPVRRRIAEHMQMSKRTSPHVTTVMEVDLSRVVAHRQDNKAAFARDGANLTFTAYFVAAAAAALRAYPLVNSSWSEQGILLHREIHIGMATSLGEEGLIVPVIRNVDELSLLGLARAINDLANRARRHQLKPDEVKGGTFSITNHGISGSLFATPIINQPQCAILGVGAIQKRVVVIDGPGGDAIAVRPMAYLTLTFDHRILDGAIADYYLGKVMEMLQEWK